MGKPAARISDMHVCPKRTGKIPHVGGPIVAGSPDVMIGGMPAARVGDMAVCVGPPDKVASGSATVFINGKPAARMGDSTSHGGKIVTGFPTVLIGDSGGSGVGGSSSVGGGDSPVPVFNAVSQSNEGELKPVQQTQSNTLASAAKNGDAFCEVCG